jgi:AraC-like DNA-binding protein
VQAPLHQSRVTATPWHGIYGTQIDSARHYGRHWHATYGFGLLQRGAQRSASGRGDVVAYAGDLIATNPGEVHDGRPFDEAPRRWRMLYLEPGVFESLMADVEADVGADACASAGTAAVVCPVIQHPQLTQVLQRLFLHIDQWGEQPEPNGVDALACDESLVRTFTGLLCAHTTSQRLAQPAAHAVQPAAHAVRWARDRLADDLLHAPTLGELASLVGLSKYQLLRRFEKTYGLPPHAWLLQQRLEKARGLIRGGHRLADAAADSGFADQSHMTRLFVRQFGFTPGAWSAISFKTASA